MTNDKSHVHLTNKHTTRSLSALLVLVGGTGSPRRALGVFWRVATCARPLDTSSIKNGGCI